MHDDVINVYDIIISYETLHHNSFIHKSFELCQAHTYVYSQVGKHSLNWALGTDYEWERKDNWDNRDMSVMFSRSTLDK